MYTMQVQGMIASLPTANKIKRIHMHMLTQLTHAY